MILFITDTDGQGEVSSGKAVMLEVSLLTVWLGSAAAGSLKWPLPSHMGMSLKQTVSWKSFCYK